MFTSERLPAGRNRLLEQRLRLRMPAGSPIEAGQASERNCYRGMVAPEGRLPYRDRLPVKRLGFGVTPGVVQKQRELIQPSCNFRVLGSERVPGDRERRAEERLGLSVSPSVAV